MDKDVETNIVPVLQTMTSGSRNNSSNNICGNGENMDNKSSIVGSCNNNSEFLDNTTNQHQLTSNQNKEHQTINILNRSINTNNNKDSLTHSQISMLSKGDHGSHLYSTPESIMANDEKPIVSSLDMSSHVDDILERKSIHNNNTELEPTKKPIMQAASPVMMITNNNHTFNPNQKQKSTFPTHIALGALQLVLSIILAALGGLVIARNAALCMAFSGIWAGAIAGITGSLAILNVRGAKTGFLAASLISVASGTLAASLTGIGLLRDWNIVHQDENLYGAINASAGLLFVLTIHLVTSIISVYHSALTVCSSRNDGGYGTENMIYNDLSFTLSHQRVEEYINSLPIETDMKEKMYQNILKGSLRSDKDKLMPFYHPQYQTPMLIPQPSTMRHPMMYSHPSPIYTSNMLYPPNLLPPGAAIYGPPTLPRDAPKLHRKRSVHSMQERSGRRSRQSKSEAPLTQPPEEDRRSFTYTGLDRAIADNYLTQQEKSQSASSINESIGAKCNDVQM